MSEQKDAAYLAKMNNVSACYKKSGSDSQQQCMYTVSGEMLCDVKGDGVNVILKNTPFAAKCNEIVTKK